MDTKKRGALIVISGPSGAGKTSICDALLKRIPDSQWWARLFAFAGPA